MALERQLTSKTKLLYPSNIFLNSEEDRIKKIKIKHEKPFRFYLFFGIQDIFKKLNSNIKIARPRGKPFN